MEIPNTIPCPVCTQPEGPEPGLCRICDGNRLVDPIALKRDQPVLAAFQEILSTSTRPVTDGTINALHDQLKALGRLLEKAETKVPIEIFAILDDDQRKIALISMAHAIINSFLKAIARQNAEKRIILPGRR